MLRTMSDPTRPVLPWTSPMAAALAAASAAALIWSAIPHPEAVPAAAPELTSGGKFAVRAVFEPAAYDGLDTMPVPRVDPPSPLLVAIAGDVSRLPRHASWKAASDASGRLGRPSPARRPPARLEARNVGFPPAAAVPSAAPAAGPAPEVAEEEGVLHRMTPSWLPRVPPTIVTAARDAWAATASAGGVLAARLVPQVP